MPLIGTAGHVDHGKSTLIRRLTGREPDRWREEQERGLTIDLGFAWMDMPSGTEVSFVDVPGHDRFIKNMLAGVEAVDVALFVVAADEGWMPQSEEHLAVLDLLDVRSGVVALTKTDRVDSDLVELATLEIEEHLEGTSLSGAAVIPVSANTGDGIDALVDVLDRLVAAVPRTAGDRPRLWVDRSFSISGAGTVVTGTLLDGPLSVGEELVTMPGDIKVKVRALQSHEHDRATVEAGYRVAVNLTGIDRENVGRGSMLGRPGQWVQTTRFVGTVETARYVDELTDRGSYHLHLGSGSWPVRIRHVSSGLIRVDLETPLPTAMGDRFILRDSGRRLVVAGGRVIDPAPPRPKRFTEHEVAQLTGALDSGAGGRAQALLDFRGSESEARLSAQTGGGSPTDGFSHGGVWLSTTRRDELGQRITSAVEEYHGRHPLRPGIGVAELAESLGLAPGMVTALIATLDGLEVDGAFASSTQFSVSFSPDQRTAIETAKRKLREAGTTEVPRASDLGIDSTLLHAVVRAGEMVQVSPDFVYLPEQIAELMAVIDGFASPFGVSEFKDRAGLSRKYAVPFLEWADATGRTVRTGDTRRRR
jgi:selenocysteine-specific elongation factor